jgi:hypothetical protein
LTCVYPRNSMVNDVFSVGGANKSSLFAGFHGG